MFTVAALAVVAPISLMVSESSQAVEPISLGTANDYAVFAGADLTYVNSTTVDGDIGAKGDIDDSKGSVAHNGTLKTSVADSSELASAQKDLDTAYMALKIHESTGAAPITGALTPGVYTAAAALTITGPLVLDTGTDANAVFVFKIGAALTLTADAQIKIIGAGSAQNVYWQVTGAVDLGARSAFVGTLLTKAAIRAGAGAAVTGRLVSIDAAVNLDSNTIDNGVIAQSSDTSESDISGFSGTDTSESETSESDTSESETSESETSESETSESETSESDTSESDTSESDTSESDTSESDSFGTDTSGTYTSVTVVAPTRVLLAEAISATGARAKVLLTEAKAATDAQAVFLAEAISATDAQAGFLAEAIAATDAQAKVLLTEARAATDAQAVFLAEAITATGAQAKVLLTEAKAATDAQAKVLLTEARAATDAQAVFLAEAITATGARAGFLAEAIAATGARAKVLADAKTDADAADKSAADASKKAAELAKIAVAAEVEEVRVYGPKSVMTFAPTRSLLALDIKPLGANAVAQVTVIPAGPVSYGDGSLAEKY